MSGEVPEPGDGPPTTRKACSDAFISYASQDKALAYFVCDALERAGIVCWIAPRDVTPGEFYADAIVRALNEARILVLVLTENAMTSPHVMREVERTSAKRHAIISLRLTPVSLPPALEYFLSASHWLDASTSGIDSAMSKLVEAVQRLNAPPSVAHPRQAGGATEAAADLVPGPPVVTQTRQVLSRVLLVVIAIVLAYLVVDRFWLPKPVTEGKPATAAGPAFKPPAYSIAVLPFVNMSGDPKQEYFSDGVSEELLDALSRLDQLHVAARTSSFSFKGQNVDASAIARKLNVGTILEGSVRRAGNTVRITAQLIDAASGFHVWSQTYDRALTDMLKAQTEVATAVAQQLKVKLVGDQTDKLALGGTQNSEAYDAYLRGEQVTRKANPTDEDNREALAAFDEAIALDPAYALAYAARARTLVSRAMFNSSATDRDLLRQQALTAAERAVALAPQLGEVHASLAITRAYGLLDFTGAAPEFDRALALAPGNARVQRLFAEFASALGHHDQALGAARRAVSLDPQNVNAYVSLGRALFHAGRYDEALDAFQTAKVLSPDSDYVEGHIYGTLMLAGQFAKALERCAAPSTPLSEVNRHYCLALAYHGVGKPADAERELAQMKVLVGDGGAYAYASLYARWGDKAAALRWLAVAERRHSSPLQSLRVDRTFDSIRGEPLFQAIEGRLKFPP